MAAVGALADSICADHPLDHGYGPGSPLAKLVAEEGRVLLLGSPPGNVTLLHHSEHMASLPDKRVIRYREKLLRKGRAEWVEMEEFDTAEPVIDSAPGDHFEQLVGAYLRTRTVPQGTVGSAGSYLFDAEPLHRFAVGWLEDRWGVEADAGPPDEMGR